MRAPALNDSQSVTDQSVTDTPSVQGNLPAAKGDLPRTASAAIVVTLLTSLALLVINAISIVVSTRGGSQSAQEIAHSYELKRYLVEARFLLFPAATQSGGPRVGVDYSAPGSIRQEWSQLLLKLQQLTQEEPGQHRLLQQLNGLLTKEFAAAGSGADATIISARARAVLQRIEAREDAGLAERIREIDRETYVARIVAAVTTSLAIAVLISLYRLLRRHLAAREHAERESREINARLNQTVNERTAELSELSQHLIRITEQEKAALARELHDALGSNLTAMNMDLRWLESRLKEADPAIVERLRRALQVLTATVELKRGVVEGLRPSLLDTLGLGHAMRSHCEEFTQRTGLPCRAEVLDEMTDIDPAWSIALYRIAQEALNNVAKYAQASNAHIRLARRPEGILLCVIDDGVGVTEGMLSSARGHGIIGMRERMRQLGGTLTVSRAAPTARGTVVEAFIPFLKDAAAAAAMPHCVVDT